MPTYFRFRVWGFGVPQGSLSTLHRHSALVCSGAHTSTRPPSHVWRPRQPLCALSPSSPHPCFCPPSISGIQQDLRPCTGGHDTSFVSSSVPGTPRGAAPAPATDVQPCLETFFGCGNWGKGCYWHLVAGGQKCCC